MSIKDCSLNNDVTALTPVGGVALPFEEDGQEVKSGIHLHAPSITDFRVRPNITVKNRNPVLLADGTYTKAKRWMTVVIPKELTSGKITFNLVRIEIEVHPESTVAETDNIAFLGAQLCSDADFQTFIRTGSLA
jgi:hypothetical protein